MTTNHQNIALRDLVEARLNRRWSDWAREHPHLAAVIDRVRLVDASVERLRDDERFQSAMRQANLDESQLAAAARLLEQAEQLVDRLLPL